MLLPNGSRAVIDPRKLTDYCLSVDHPAGRHKARVFRSVLGLTQADAGVLRDLLLDAAVRADATPTNSDEYGTRYVTDFVTRTATGTATVRAAWIVRAGEDFPTFVTSYVLPG